MAASSPWVKRAFLALTERYAMIPLSSGAPATSHDGNMARSDACAEHPYEPPSRELGDRNARAGAAPGRVPVRGRSRCGTALAQEFSQDSAVAWPRRSLAPDPSKTRPIGLASTRGRTR